jgi:hypothetical protein
MSVIEVPLRSAVLFLLTIGLGFLGQVLFYVMIGEVNRNRPEDQQVSYSSAVWWGIGRAYRMDHPSGWLYELAIALQLISVVVFLGMIADVVVFGPTAPIQIPLAFVALVSGALGFIGVSVVVVVIMVGEVNRKLSDAERLSYLFIVPGRVRAIRRAYLRSYPRGYLDMLRLSCNALAAFLILAIAGMYLISS